jgi:uncharacterized membrane protein
LSVWAIPTAIVAFAIHAVRLFIFDKRLARILRASAEKARA